MQPQAVVRQHLRLTGNAAAKPPPSTGRYIRQVAGAVEKKWRAYRVLQPECETYGSLQLAFYINQHGRVENLRVVNDKESSDVLTNFTLQAVRDTKIPAMPAEVIPALQRQDLERLQLEYMVSIMPRSDIIPKALPGAIAFAQGDAATQRYLLQVKEQLRKKWRSYKAQKLNDMAFGSLSVRFFLTPEGRVENMHVKNTRETHPELTRFTVKAIQDAEIPPMPAAVIAELKAVGLERLELAYIFHHRPTLSGQSAMNVKNALARPELRKEMAMRWGMPVQTEGVGAQATKAPENTAMQAKDMATPKGRYIRQVLDAVEKKWHLYCKLRRDGMTYGHFKVAFCVNKKGKVEDLRIIDDKESNPVLTDITKQAILDAEIPPMPADVIPLLPKDSPERLKIDYNALIY